MEGDCSARPPSAAINGIARHGPDAAFRCLTGGDRGRHLQRSVPQWTDFDKEDQMRRKLMWGLVVSGVIAVAATYVDDSRATPASGFAGTTIAVGRFADIDVVNHAVRSGSEHPARSVWHSIQKTNGESDVYVQSNVWAPGGSTGWHTHPGHSLITVTAGALAAYDADDPSCTPKVYTAGMGFVDPGGDHVHLLRNAGPGETRTITVQVIPAGAPRRVDAPAPGNCPF